ncbi:hypothetical protein NWE60_02130 [Mycoplasmopsis felis]|nr:hypothetical protein [Mycoplasmopsis felis]WAM01410.1 hypothetical protein NWE60_02130 [Mycoplasmopsis felis]
MLIVYIYRGGSHNLVSFEVNSENPNFSARDGILYRNNFIEILSTPGQNTRTEIVIPKETSDLRDGKEIFNTPNLTNIVVESETTLLLHTKESYTIMILHK